MKKLLIAFVTIGTLLSACKKEDIVPMGDFTVTIENVSTAKTFSNSDIFNTPVGAANPGAIGPNGQYEFTVKAGKGEKLSLITMFVESNDLFYAPDENGIPLYDATGNQLSGDITDQFSLWDAGTEVNEEPGVGPNQVMRQADMNTGPAENGSVQKIETVGDGFTYPAVNEVIRVELSSVSDTEIKVTITNVSTSTTLNTSQGPKAVPLSPGLWAVHSGDSPLFASGESDRGEGIEAIAEDGNPANLKSFADANTGIVYPLSPGTWAVHEEGKPIFESGDSDFGEGLEAIAEDGSPASLTNALQNKDEVSASGSFDTPVGSNQPAAIGPGGMYKFSFSAEEGDMLSFVTMFVQSNDLFYSPSESGIALFSNGTALSGDITNMLSLYDAGTEVNEEPGFGPNQVIRQNAANTGIEENGNVSIVNDAFSYPTLSDVIKVTIETN